MEVMYNPQHLHECEKEKQRPEREKPKKREHRKLVDTLMTAVGLIASVSNVPQVLKIWRTQEVADISLITYLVALGTVSAWFAYGIYVRNYPLMITTSVTLLVLGTVVGQIFYYGYVI